MRELGKGIESIRQLGSPQGQTMTQSRAELEGEKDEDVKTVSVGVGGMTAAVPILSSHPYQKRILKITLPVQIFF